MTEQIFSRVLFVHRQRQQCYFGDVIVLFVKHFQKIDGWLLFESGTCNDYN